MELKTWTFQYQQNL